MSYQQYFVFSSYEISNYTGFKEWSWNMTDWWSLVFLITIINTDIRWGTKDLIDSSFRSYENKRKRSYKYLYVEFSCHKTYSQTSISIPNPTFSFPFWNIDIHKSSRYFQKPWNIYLLFEMLERSNSHVKSIRMVVKVAPLYVTMFPREIWAYPNMQNVPGQNTGFVLSVASST